MLYEDSIFVREVLVWFISTKNFSEYLKKKKKLYWYFSIWKIRKNNLKKFYQNIPAKSGNRSKERDYRESYINIFIRMGRNWGFSQRVMRVQYFFSKRGKFSVSILSLLCFFFSLYIFFEKLKFFHWKIVLVNFVSS